MTLTEFAFNNMKRRPARTLFTIVGIALAIGTAVAMLALGRGINESISKGIEEHGVEFVVTQRRSTDMLNARLPEDLVASIAAVPGVKSATGQLFAFAMTGDDRQVLLSGWQAGSDAWNAIPLKEGRLPAPGTRQVLIGDAIADSMEVGIGEEIDIFDEYWQIAGITGYQTVMNRGIIILPLSLLQEAALREGQISMISVRLDPALDEQAAEALRGRIATQFAVTVSETSEVIKDDYNIRFQRAVAGAISAMALTMGALNLLSTMLMSVQERTREIGMLTAMGWNTRRVVSLIMLEGLLIGIAGCIGGIGVGVFASRMFGFLDVGDFVSFMPATGDLLLPLALALPLCAAGAAYPAWRAVQLLPAEAMRRF